MDKLLGGLRAALVAAEARNAALVTENAALRTDKERQAEENDQLRRQLAAILNKVFHKTSEKMDPAQLWMNFASLIDDAQRALLEERARAEAKKQAPRKSRERAPRGAAAIDADVKRERQVVEPREELRRCEACEKGLRRIGEDVSSQLVWVPGHFVLKETVRGKWACTCGMGTVLSEPAPEAVIPRSIATPSLLGHLVVSKYADHLPLHRQVGILRRSGVRLAISTLSDWLHEVAVMLRPVCDVLVADVLASEIVALDDTRLEMQRNSKKLKRKRCFLWGYRTPDGVTVFDFSTSRGGAEPLRFLGSMRGYVQNDAYVAHDGLFTEGSGRVRVGCWAHARRRFVDALDAEPERASLAIALIGRLYDVEREAREGNLDAAARARIREQRCPQILSMLHELLEMWALDTLPKSGLGEAITYTLGQWETLVRYVHDGRLEIDNTAIERAIRGIALGRNNHLFVGSEQGGHDAALFYSLIESCRSAGVEPMAYLVDVIGRIRSTPADQMAALTPARWKVAGDAADPADAAAPPAAA